MFNFVVAGSLTITSRSRGEREEEEEWRFSASSCAFHLELGHRVTKMRSLLSHLRERESRGLVSYHLASLLGAIELTVFLTFMCKVECFDAQIRKTQVYKSGLAENQRLVTYESVEFEK